MFSVAPALAQLEPAALESRRFRYVLGSDLGLLLGFNGPQLRQNAEQGASDFGAVHKMGNFLRYGLSGTLYFGMAWPLGNRKPMELGFQLRGNFSIGETVSTYFKKSSPVGNFYNQQDLRSFLALQPALYFSYRFASRWMLELIMGASLTWNFYLRYRAEHYAAGKKLTDRTVVVGGAGDSALRSPFNLGAVAGVSLSRYFYPFLASGISLQYLLGVSPPNGAYSLGQLVFGLHFYFTW